MGNKKSCRKFVLLVEAVVMFILWYFATMEPSHEREWEFWHEVMPYAEIDGDIVNLYNVRDFTWRAADSADVSYFNETFNLSSVKKVYFLVEFWTEFDWMAHTMFSFEYGDGRYLVVSVESRKEKGEGYSAIGGLFNKYELIYVIGTESDMLPLRTRFYKDRIYMYPLRVEPEQAQALFIDILDRVNSLRKKPEWYNSLFNSCTGNLVEHAERTLPGFELGISKYLPGYSDKKVYDARLIETELPYEKIREHFEITSASNRFRGRADFSEMIRKGF